MIFSLPPPKTCGLIRTKQGLLEPYFFPNFSNTERLSKLTIAPFSTAYSISEKSTPLGVNVISEPSKPANKPNSNS